MKKFRILAILLILGLFSVYWVSPEPVQAQSGTPAEVIAYINALRASYGLDPLIENIYLDIAAQNHANWIAETGIGSHTGEDGSTAYDRAVAVGYGAGGNAWVTENWARGYNLTAYGCVYDMWAPSEAHLDNMLTTWHNEFGVGVALDSNGFTVYVANFGHTTVGDTGQVTSDPNIELTPGAATATYEPLVYAVVTATPAPDGTIIHTVQYGETLYGIAEAYGVSITDLFNLNGYNEETVIYPGEQVIIVQGTGETPTPTATMAEATPTPTPTREVTSTPAVAVDITPTPTVEVDDGPGFLANVFSGDTLWVGIGLVAVSVFGLALLLFTSSRLK